MGAQTISSESHSGFFAFGPKTKLKNTNRLYCTEGEMLKCQNSIVKALSVCIATIGCAAEKRACFVKASAGIKDPYPVLPFPGGFEKNSLAIKMLLTSVTCGSCLSKPTVNIQNVCVNTYMRLAQVVVNRTNTSLTVDGKLSAFSGGYGKRFINFQFFHILQRGYCRTPGHIIPCLYADT